MRHHFHRCGYLRVLELDVREISGARKGGRQILEELCEAKRLAPCVGLAECDVLSAGQKRELLARARHLAAPGGGRRSPLADARDPRAAELEVLRRDAAGGAQRDRAGEPPARGRGRRRAPAQPAPALPHRGARAARGRRLGGLRRRAARAAHRAARRHRPRARRAGARTLRRLRALRRADRDRAPARGARHRRVPAVRARGAARRSHSARARRPDRALQRERERTWRSTG